MDSLNHSGESHEYGGGETAILVQASGKGLHQDKAKLERKVVEACLVFTLLRCWESSSGEKL